VARANPGNGDQARGTSGAQGGAIAQGGAMQARERDEQRLERGYSVRQVTDYQASWTEQGRGTAGKFTVQLILDNGVEEYILQTTADDLDVLLALLKRSGHTMFDLDRKVLMFSNLDAAD
jgi:hypothetical protein